MKLRYSFLILIFWPSLLKAQINISPSDFPQPGITIEYYTGGNLDSVDLGNPGGNQVFDFSKGVLNTFQDSFIISMVTPASTGFGADHPNSTVAFLSDSESDSATGQIVFELWEFLQNTATGSQFLGLTANLDTGNLFSNSPPTSMTPAHVTYSSPTEHIHLNWQMGYQSSYTNKWTAIIGPLKHDETIYRELEIDAWGTFKNPWREFDALRLKVKEYLRETDTLNGQSDWEFTDSTYYYEYWVKNLGHYIARVYADSSYSSFWQLELANQREPLGIEDNFDSRQIRLYPNPTQQDLYIEADQEDWLNYEIYDLNGKLLSKGNLSPAKGRRKLPVEGLPAATYILKLSDESGIIGYKKVLLIR
jgi:Secretion system C-terminal sorting domain